MAIPTEPLRTLRVIWAAITFSTVLLLAVLVEVRGQHHQAQAPMMVPMFAFTAVTCLVVGILLPARQLRLASAHAGRAQVSRVIQGAILGLALTESVALFGFVLGFLGFSSLAYMPFFAAGWLVFALRFPQPTRPLGFLGPAV